MGSHSKAQAQAHAAGIVLYRGVHESLHLGKSHDFVELVVDLGSLHTQDGAVQVDVLSAGQLLMKASAYFQEGSHPTKDIGVAFCWLCDAGKHFEQRTFARSIVTNDAYNWVSFQPVRTSALRLEIQSQDEFSAGILEWKAQ